MIPRENKYFQSYAENSDNPGNKSNQENLYFIAADEVGRGSLFGPVTVGAVAIPFSSLKKTSDFVWFHDVKDSKKVSLKKRVVLSEKISQKFLYNISHVSSGYIDKYNINRAIQYGLYRASGDLQKKLQQQNKNARIEFILMDGSYRFSYPQVGMSKPLARVIDIIKGDATYFSIACASILAKQARDQLIRSVHSKYEHFDLINNVGYGTKAHREGLRNYGPSKYHRKTFLKKIVKENIS